MSWEWLEAEAWRVRGIGGGAMPALPSSSILLPLGGERGASGYLEVIWPTLCVFHLQVPLGGGREGLQLKRGVGGQWLDRYEKPILSAPPPPHS